MGPTNKRFSEKSGFYFDEAAKTNPRTFKAHEPHGELGTECEGGINFFEGKS